MDFKKFKRNRKKINEVAKKMKSEKPSYVDDRFWEITKDKQGNGEAVIRFAPQPSEEKAPCICKSAHGFKENNKWFFEDCPTTIGEKCPVCDYVQPYWDEGTENSKKIAGRYSRKKQFYCNILVVKDPAKPENNGKVFLFKFGVKIMNMIEAKVAPDSELSEQLDIFDLWEGHDFILKVKKVYGYPNYDDSTFYTKSKPIAETDDEIEAIFKQLRMLDEFVDPKKFSSYETIQKKFNAIMGKKAGKVEIEDTFDTETTSKKDESTETTVKKDESTETTAKKDDDLNFDDGDDDFNFDDGDFSFDD